MSARNASIPWIAWTAVALGLAALVLGTLLADPSRVARDCSGDNMYGSDLCEAARLSQAIFGASIAAAGIIAIAILLAAVILANRHRPARAGADSD